MENDPYKCRDFPAGGQIGLLYIAMKASGIWAEFESSGFKGTIETLKWFICDFSLLQLHLLSEPFAGL